MQMSQPPVSLLLCKSETKLPPLTQQSFLEVSGKASVLVFRTTELNGVAGS
jgi:hypothetical protein